MRRVLGVAVPEVVLHRTKIRTLIGQIVAARVPKDVGPDPSKPSFLPSQSHDVVDGLASHELAALGYKQPRKFVLAVAT
jgi:hypothetical protein